MSDYIDAYRRQRIIKQNSDKLKINQHSLIAMTADEYVNFVMANKFKGSATKQEIIDWFDNVIQGAVGISSVAKETWEKGKKTWISNTDGLSVFKEFLSYKPVFDDSKVLAALAVEMHRSGGILTQYRVSTNAAGKSYIPMILQDAGVNF